MIKVGLIGSGKWGAVIVNAINDTGAITWKYEGQDDAAEIAIHQIVGSLLKQVPMSGVTRAATLSALGFSQNAFD